MQLFRCFPALTLTDAEYSTLTKTLALISEMAQKER
jgi:hypothetical protein